MNRFSVVLPQLQDKRVRKLQALRCGRLPAPPSDRMFENAKEHGHRVLPLCKFRLVPTRSQGFPSVEYICNFVLRTEEVNCCSLRHEREVDQGAVSSASPCFCSCTTCQDFEISGCAALFHPAFSTMANSLLLCSFVQRWYVECRACALKIS